MLLSTIGTVLVSFTIFVIAVALLTGRSLRELTESGVMFVRNRLPAFEFKRDTRATEEHADGQATVARKGLISRRRSFPFLREMRL